MALAAALLRLLSNPSFGIAREFHWEEQELCQDQVCRRKASPSAAPPPPPPPLRKPGLRAYGFGCPRSSTSKVCYANEVEQRGCQRLITATHLKDLMHMHDSQMKTTCKQAIQYVDKKELLSKQCVKNGFLTPQETLEWVHDYFSEASQFLIHKNFTKDCSRIFEKCSGSQEKDTISPGVVTDRDCKCPATSPIYGGGSASLPPAFGSFSSMANQLDSKATVTRARQLPGTTQMRGESEGRRSWDEQGSRGRAPRVQKSTQLRERRAEREEGLAKGREPEDSMPGPSFDQSFLPPNTEKHIKKSEHRDTQGMTVTYVTVPSVLGILLAVGGLLFYLHRSRISGRRQLQRDESTMESAEEGRLQANGLFWREKLRSPSPTAYKERSVRHFVQSLRPPFTVPRAAFDYRFDRYS
ncbi:Macrophage colony-stimulating factor 1 [Varanus komodoensis]|nr:Macrophage colony-stimulating factor 1 [Varanus komodoensis]